LIAPAFRRLAPFHGEEHTSVSSVLRERRTLHLRTTHRQNYSSLAAKYAPIFPSDSDQLSGSADAVTKFRRSPRHRTKLKHYDIACDLDCARRLNVERSAVTRGRNWLCCRQRPPEVTDWSRPRIAVQSAQWPLGPGRSPHPSALRSTIRPDPRAWKPAHRRRGSMAIVPD
jgi:hypothetical protein